MQELEIFSDILSAQNEQHLRAAMNRMESDQKYHLLMAVYEVVCQIAPKDAWVMVAPLTEEQKVELLVGMFNEMKAGR